MRSRIKYVNTYQDRHGRVRRYFRRKGQSRIPLPGEPGSPEFEKAYQTALAGIDRDDGPSRRRARP